MVLSRNPTTTQWVCLFIIQSIPTNDYLHRGQRYEYGTGAGEEEAEGPNDVRRLGRGFFFFHLNFLFY